MSNQGLETIDHTVHVTHDWINELADRLDWSSKRSALRLLRVTMHQIRDNLLIDEMAQFSAQLPLLIRGMFFEGWVPKRTPLKDRHLGDFCAPIESMFEHTLEYRGIEDITRVFVLLNNRLSRGEIEDVRANLPTAIREIWPEP